MRPERRLEAQTGQVLCYAVVNLAGNAVAFGVNGFRFAPTLFLGG